MGETGHWGYALKRYILSLTPFCYPLCFLAATSEERFLAMPFCHEVLHLHRPRNMEVGNLGLKPLKP
jgi:hypothetical protein